MIRVRTTSVAETAAVAHLVAAHVTAGDLILLTGDLGAGKTAFCQGLGAALGVVEPVTSPTFTLVREYEGRLRLYHLDVYRIGELAEVADLALGEMLDDDAVTVIEWGTRIAAALPRDHLEIRLELGDDDDERLMTLLVTGPSWSARRAHLAELCGAFPVGDSSEDGSGPATFPHSHSHGDDS